MAQQQNISEARCVRRKRNEEAAELSMDGYGVLGQVGRRWSSRWVTDVRTQHLSWSAAGREGKQTVRMREK